MKSTKVGIIGSGQVAQTLGRGFLESGYKVMLSSRDESKLDEWQSDAGEHAKKGTFAEAAAYGDIVVLAVAGVVAEDAVKLAGIDNLKGKTVIDVTNPIAKEAPVNGVLKFFSDINESLMERLQRLAPEARFVKCFSCVGNHYMYKPQFADGVPTMFICGDNDEAKHEVKDILEQFGWEYEDMGGAEAARAIEPLCMLWCIPGFRENRWTHAFKLLKA